MIILVYAKKFDKIQNPFMVVTLRKLRTEMTSFNLIKNIYKISQADINLIEI